MVDQATWCGGCSGKRSEERGWRIGCGEADGFASELGAGFGGERRGVGCEGGGPDVEDGLADESAGVLVCCSYGHFDLDIEVNIRTAGQERERSGTHAVDLDVLLQRTRACRVEIARHDSAALLSRRHRKRSYASKSVDDNVVRRERFDETAVLSLEARVPVDQGEVEPEGAAGFGLRIRE